MYVYVAKPLIFILTVLFHFQQIKASINLDTVSRVHFCVVKTNPTHA